MDDAMLPSGRTGLPGGPEDPERAVAELESRLAQAVSRGEPAAAELDHEAIASASIGDRQTLMGHVDPGAIAGLADRVAERLEAGAGEATRWCAWDLLDLLRRSSFLRRLPADSIATWSDRILRLVDASHLTVGPLFRRRAELYGYKVLFEVPRRGGDHRSVTWLQAAARVDFLARGLLSLDDEREPGPVAILAENSLEMALADLACLTAGIVDVMIPAAATERDVRFMLEQSGARTVIVSGAAQLKKVLPHRDELPALNRIVTLNPIPALRDPAVMELDEVMSRAVQVDSARVVARSEAVRSGDLATIMYTSGTTGVPKGIRFSHRNLVFKRFARGLALPEIGEQDVFVSFLPLYHTFGRFLEMLGAIFWGATYCFVENPSVEALIQAMRKHRPSVFISVPKKWIQLYEAIVRQADPHRATDAELSEATRSVVGDRLRWGLSAAGHLDAEIFRFFQSQGVELMSGFGMTEATGGITMTPPGEYSDDSLGLPLPGIETKLDDDGELLVRGPYVMLGYVAPPEGERGFDDDGWFHTGDLMQRDTRQHIRLIDRKKEIYKNVKGETIAPQRVENLFRDFASVGRVFLVGDHKEYNTLLIYPNPTYDELDFGQMSVEARREHFRSLVVSVNKFLAPYERVVDFALIDRDLEEGRGELTAKGTPRRKAIAENFTDTIRRLYRRTSLEVGGLALTFPNWLFQILGLTAQDITVDGDRLLIPSRRSELIVRRTGEGQFQVGDHLYNWRGGPVDLGVLLADPSLWLGNGQLVDFVPLGLASRVRSSRGGRGVTWAGQAAPQDPSRIPPPPEGDRPGLLHLDRAVRRMSAASPGEALSAIDTMGTLLGAEQESLAEATRMILRRTARTGSSTIARAAFRALIPAEKDSRFERTFSAFLQAHPDLLDEVTIRSIVESGLGETKLLQLIETAERYAIEVRENGHADPAAERLIDLLAAYGGAHPAAYRRVRPFLTRVRLFSPDPGLRRRAGVSYLEMRGAFRDWLGPNSRVAVDPETRREYRWRDAVTFADEVPATDRSRLLDALESTPLLTEAVFLFTQGVMLRLSDLPVGGVSIRPLGAGDGKAVYRLTAQTRHQGAFDVAVNVNEGLSDATVDEEIQLLLLCHTPHAPHPLVEEFGGHFPDQDLWTEEFITGRTLDRALARLAAEEDAEERLRPLWPFLAWSALSAYVDFWDRSGRRWEIAATDMSNVIVPTQDYQSGARIVSLIQRRPHTDLPTMLRSFRSNFIDAAERRYRMLTGLAGWGTIFASVLQIVGETEGLSLLERAVEGSRGEDGMAAAFERFRTAVQARGFLPLRLYFAGERYLAWASLNETATREARARTLQQLYETYGLARLAQRYPEVRVRFFRETVLRDVDPALGEALEKLIHQLRRHEIRGDEVIDGVADVRSRIDVDEDADYFLARLSFPYLRPEDPAGYVAVHAGGRPQSEMVVALEDQEGQLFRVRHAVNPKEVERLHRLFVASKVDVQFRPEHQYLVALSDRSQCIGGIFYALSEDGESAHLEKIVVSDSYRRKGVAQGLMNEFFNRLRSFGVRFVTTGFFRPEFFYAWGFRVEKRFAGLVKPLAAEEDPHTP